MRSKFVFLFWNCNFCQQGISPVHLKLFCVSNTHFFHFFPLFFCKTIRFFHFLHFALRCRDHGKDQDWFLPKINHKRTEFYLNKQTFVHGAFVVLWQTTYLLLDLFSFSSHSHLSAAGIFFPKDLYPAPLWDSVYPCVRIGDIDSPFFCLQSIKECEVGGTRLNFAAIGSVCWYFFDRWRCEGGEEDFLINPRQSS